ncbi:hypothetical protein [Lactiplantibacillus mudanjiangensis]|uniref:Uncharacterized protein n=1 Tax=Lactiplantibacillus mudanjiangensis TaxID=1296538 RepID=A0A660DU62_9LACO|nr:hypothetical protein [Lactiplantibacillus mudanjiangensis]VDG22468.1 hypothetical protein MUDAN_IGPPGNFN_00038 [Lactiplantibacillus mudanjiangensis]VDG26999.1 hypothetical protein MUDAN_MDHGFNIF_00369 [Lactiplantibacillus mudanjiangensis]
MTKPLAPADMQSLLTHDQRYVRAAAILKDQWLNVVANEDRLDRQRIQPEDLQFAKALVASGALTSRWDFDSYAGVQKIRQQFGNQLSSAAQRILIQPYV